MAPKTKFCKCDLCTNHAEGPGCWVTAREYKDHQTQPTKSDSEEAPATPQPGLNLFAPTGSPLATLQAFDLAFDSTFARSVPPLDNLVFVERPRTQPTEHGGEMNLGLDPLAISNRGVLRHLQGLSFLIRDINAVDVLENDILRATRQNLLEKANGRRRYLHQLICAKGRGKTKQFSKDDELIVDCSPFEIPQGGDTLTLIYALFVLILHLIYHFARKGSNFSLRYLKAVPTSYGFQIPKDTSQHPVDLRTALKLFNLEAKLTSYICCSACYTLYKETEDYPLQCTNEELGVVCGADLTKMHGEHRRPSRTFYYQSPIDWLGRFLQRPGMEEIIDRPKVYERLAGAVLKDVFDGDFVRTLTTSDGRWFFEAPGRYLFALGIDGFNPLDKEGTHKPLTATGIWMALVNLPIHLRYRPENICFVGVVAGEPTGRLGHYNALLKPLIDDLILLWDHGVKYSTTYNHPEGKSAKAALGPILNDLKAARPIGGFMTSTHGTFMCSCCTAEKSDLHAYDRVFSPRDKDDHIAAGLRWRDAKTLQERLAVEDTTGTRWVEPMRLAYFDGTVMIMHEGMHGVSNVVSWHWCRFWGMSNSKENDDAVGPRKKEPGKGNTFPKKQTYLQAEQIAYQGTDKQLAELADGTLKALAAARDLRTGGQLKADVLQALREWRRDRGICDMHNNLIAVELPPSVTLLATEMDLSAATDALSHMHSTKKQMDKFRRPILLELCRIRGIQHEPSTFKSELIDKLIEWRDEYTPLPGANDPNPPRSWENIQRKGAVIGRQMLEAYRELRKGIHTPSYVKLLPEKLGSIARITADEWESVSRIGFVFLLIPVWSREDSTQRDKDFLENFIHLITALIALDKESVDEHRIETFRTHYAAYRKGVDALFKAESLPGNSHMLSHAADVFLPAWGPIRGMRASSFEKTNGMAQEITTNSKEGELEGTMMRMLCSMATLLTRIIDQTLPEDLHFLNPLLREDSNGFLASVSPYDFSLESRAVEGSEWAIPRGHPELISRNSPEHKILQAAQIPHEEPWYALRCDKITRAGRTFRTGKASAPDATVQFHASPSSISSGVIQTIYVLFKAHRKGFTAQQVYVTIKKHVPLTPADGIEDPFKQYPDLGVWLVRDKLEPTAELVAASAILSHVATCRYMMTPTGNDEGRERVPCLGILPLDSV